MGEKNRAYDRFLGTGNSTERLQFFSDAVFAIAMTLLVIDIAVPTVSQSISDAKLDTVLWKAIASEWPHFFAYAISFAVIGVNWVGHHRKFAITRAYDGGLLSRNLFFLFFIAFVPYPTSLISEYGPAIPAIVFYASVVAILSLLQFWLWSYSYRKGFLDEKVDLGMYRYVRRNLLVVPVVFLVSIPIAFLFGGIWTMYFWILNWPVSAIVGRYEPKVSRSRDSAS
jgi:uncharacterized membrane protein